MSRSITTIAALAAEMTRDHYTTSGVDAATSRFYQLCARLIGQRTGQSTVEVMDAAVAIAAQND